MTEIECENPFKMPRHYYLGCAADLSSLDPKLCAMCRIKLKALKQPGHAATLDSFKSPGPTPEKDTL